MRRIFVAASIALVGCASEGAPALPEWRVVVSTDAPVPQFGDRLLVEILDDKGVVCSGCQRELGVDDPTAWPISFGIVPDGASLRVRVRLYRAVLSGADGPSSDRVLDAITRLPTAQGVTEVDVPLAMRCFGVAADPVGSTSCDPSKGVLVPVVTASPAIPLAVGSWAPAASTSCAVPSGVANMICIPGGAFLLGDPSYLPMGDFDPVPEQLVQIPSFYLDEDEFSVSDWRALPNNVGMPKSDGGDCTYTASPGLNEGMPLNCVTLDMARAACNALGKRLPTEAEWEWAAGNLGLETPYPWIDGGDPCKRAVVAKNSGGSCLDVLEMEMPGLRAGGSALDVTSLGVKNLGGSVSEWLEDAFVPYTDPSCWGPGAALETDPVCTSSTTNHSLRGGNWSGLSVYARVTVRNAILTSSEDTQTGFRCAK